MKLQYGFNRFVDFAGALIFSVITLVSLAQIINRYVFGHSFVFAEELAVQLMIWIAFLGAAKCVSVDAHTRLTVIVAALPPALRRWTLLLSNLLCIGFLAVAAWYGFGLVRRTWSATTIGTHVPEGLVYLAMPFCSLVMILFLVGKSVALFGRPVLSESAEP